MYRGISMQLHRELDFASVHESVEDVAMTYSVEEFPTVLVLKVWGGV
jgi:hypothetical protein